MNQFMFASIRRRHNALWVQLVYMEPFGDPTWCVWAHRDGASDLELSRSSSRLIAIWRAFRRPQ